jgi:hypothetical protein
VSASFGVCPATNTWDVPVSFGRQEEAKSPVAATSMVMISPRNSEWLLKHNSTALPDWQGDETGGNGGARD